MTEHSTLPGGRDTQTFHGLTADAVAQGEATEAPAFSARGVYLGRYLVLDLLGRGGMGEVYVAYDPELDRKVALKILRRGLAGWEAQARLMREAQSAARLTHPNVVRVYDVGMVGDRVFVAMELVDGQTLADWLARGRRSWREVLRVFVAAGHGLAAAHASGLIHHDFKPGNVMLTEAGEARIIDFGIAHPGQEEGEGAQPGTPAYLAPERLTSGPVDMRSDQFSFCVALYEALCGEHPFFSAADPAGSLERLRHGRLKSSSPVRTLPGWLVQALRRGLRPSPMERFPTMDALLAVLARGLRRRQRVWLGAAAAVLLASGGFAGYLSHRSAGVELCSGAERRLIGVWDTARKQQIQTAFAATGLSLANATWRRVEAALDRHAADWLAMRQDACEATHRRGEQSVQVLDARMLCLDERLAELRVVSDLFAAADRDVVLRASESLSKLSGLSACGPHVELTALAPLPADPATRQRIARLHSVFEGHQTRFELGQAVELGQAEQAIAEARSIAYAPLVARAFLLRARLRLEAGDSAAAVSAAEEALLAAIAGGDRLLQARIYVLLLETSGYYQADHAAARRWKRFVEASIAALGTEHPEIEFHGQMELSRYAWIAGDRAETDRRARRALAIGELLWGPEDLRLARTLNNLALENTTGSRTYLERALVIRTKHLGADNPRLAPALANLAAHHAAEGRYRKALELSLRSLDLLRRFYPGGGAEAAYPELLTGQILLAEDRPDEAEAYLRRALRSAVDHFGGEHGLVADALVSLSRTLVLQERLDEAGTQLDRAERIAVSALPSQHPFRLELLDARGFWWLERQRPEAARRSLRDASALVVALSQPPRSRISTLCGLGEAELVLGRSERARDELEAALERIEPGTEPLLRARIRFALARALPPSEHERARRLAATALEELPGLSPWSRRFRQKIEAWLAARGEGR